MPIRVKCRSCSKELRLKDSAAGKSIKCPECEAPIRVPQAKPADDEWDEYEEEEYDEPQPRRRSPARTSSGSGGKKKGKKSAKQSNQTPLIIGGAIGGVVLIGAIVAFLMSGGDDDNGAGGGVAATEGGTTDATGTAATTGTTPSGGTTPAGTAGSTTTGTTGAGPAGPTVLTAPATPSGWPLAADPSALPWGETTKIANPDSALGMAFSSAPTAAVALGFGTTKIGLQGSRSVNLGTGEQIGSIDVVTPEAGLKSLSPDGTMLAFIHGDREQLHQVTVWSYLTGQKVRTIDIEKPKEQIKSISLTSPTRLLTFSETKIDGKPQRALKLFDVTAGTAIKQLAFKDVFDLTHCTISPGGKYLAYLIDSENLLVLNIETLQVVASARFSHASYASSKGVAFNTTGDRIACGFHSNNKTQILVVDLATGASSVGGEFTGDVTYSPISGSIYLGTSLEWLPGDKGWCASGSCIVDAESGKAVWYIDSASRVGSQRRRPAPDGLLVPMGTLIDRKLTLVPIPWEAIRQTLAASANDADALLRKGGSVSVQVDVGALSHGDKAQTVAGLTESLTKRLADDELTVAPNSAITVYAHYSEKAGHMASSMMDRTKQVQTTNALIKLEWRDSGGKAMRSLETTVDPSFVRVKEFTAAAYRDAMFDKAKTQLAACQFPYYIPSGSSQLTLPGLTIYQPPDPVR
ncbi:MAG: WD40 repeat domain-containing protein [Planctomycetota bacterium]|nr:WD40 repeat domain-containing protein [Planctomycetota bacterium]